MLQAAIANVLFTLVMVIGFGITMAMTPLTAIAVGRGQDRECGVILRQGLILNLLSGMALCGLTIVLSENIRFLNQPVEIIAPSALYMKVLGLSIIPMMVFQSYKQFAEGLSFVRPAMIIYFFEVSAFAAYWYLGLPSGYILAFKFNMGVRGVWYGLLISLTISAILMMSRFHFKSKQLIS